MNYIIYCDESAVKGRFYSNFYGGVLVRASHQSKIESALQEVKDSERVFDGELKWTKITDKYEAKYIRFIETFFEFVKADEAKVRIMFTQNINSRPRVEAETSGNEYFMLYYQFLKHAFGLHYSGHDQNLPATVSVYLDDVPQKQEEYDQFKDYLSSLSTYPFFRSKGISIPRSNISSIDSKRHNILQAVDLILGAMQFRLNDKHLEKPAGSRVRGKRTRSKERVYKRINFLIRETYPNFNVGSNTGLQNGPSDRWTHKYRHWSFVPNDSTKDLTRGKRK